MNCDHRGNNPRALCERQTAGHFALVAAADERIVGVIEIRNHRHISLLFVTPELHGRGIARQLWIRALQLSQANDPGVPEFTVNSSLYAVPVYEKLGFCQTAPEQNQNGLRFVPMAYKV